MIPVTQTKVMVYNSKGERLVAGNCFAACVASLLEVPIEEVPNVEVFMLADPNGNSWVEVMDKFFELKGYEWRTSNEFALLHKPAEELTDEEKEICESLRGKVYMVCGMAARGVMHQCIYSDGRLLHDPHPSREGLLECKYFEVLEKRFK